MNPNPIHCYSLQFIPLLIFLLLTPRPLSAAHFHFPSFSSRNITLLGDSYLKNGVVGLTRDATVPSTSSGAALYNLPVQFSDSAFSFSTNFSFSISNLNPASSGDGLAFFLSPLNQTLGSPGGYLGLLNSSELAEKNRFIAVEFDTKLDPQFGDPDDNHVGLDVESLVSVKTANLGTLGIDLRSGFPINAWIDYRNDQRKLRAYVALGDSKPKSPILEVDIDLSDHLKQSMYLGFSGSTEGSTALHMIRSWSFQTFRFPPSKPRTIAHNVTDNSSVIITGTKTDHKTIRLGLAIGIPSLFCCLLAIFMWVSVEKWKGMKKKQRSFKAEIMPGPKEFSYKELKEATRGFHSSRILGNGAFGTVYKAIFIDSGAISAVKRSKHSHEGKTEFLAELSIIACLTHKNLVRLQGWCIEKGELLLVYEFMPNGSLDNALYPESDTKNLTPGGLPWQCRYNIALGLASVLSYLHEECEQQVIHRDIKTSNVMLDSSFNPRLGDFGLARLTEHDKSPVSTLTAGTMGYLAPEYLQFGIATEKTDVFSYGVVILELACGRRPIIEGERAVNLVDYVWGLHAQGRIISASDQRLKGEFGREEMERLLMIGLSCASPDCSARPGMRRVLRMLEKEAQLPNVPRAKPTLVFSCTIPVSIEEIVSDDETDQCHEEEGAGFSCEIEGADSSRIEV